MAPFKPRRIFVDGIKIPAVRSLDVKVTTGDVDIVVITVMAADVEFGDGFIKVKSIQHKEADENPSS